MVNVQRAHDVVFDSVRFAENRRSDDTFHALHADITLTHSGPRATPTIVDGYVYTVGATGQLNCLGLSSGKRRWSVNILEDNDVENRLYGQSGSPLVVGEVVIVSPGGGNGRSLVAYRKDTGKRVWRSGSEMGGYDSPTLMTIANTRQVVMSNERGIAAYDPETGDVLWTHSWQDFEGAHHVQQPIQVAARDGRVLVSSREGSRLIEVSKTGDSFVVKELWANRGLRTKFSTVVVRGNGIVPLAVDLRERRLCCDSMRLARWTPPPWLRDHRGLRPTW